MKKKNPLESSTGQLSRIQLCQDITYFSDAIHEVKRKNTLYVTVSSLIVYLTLRRFLFTPLFNHFHDPLESFFSGWVNQKISAGNEQILSAYAALREFKFPVYCQQRFQRFMSQEVATLATVPWELSALIPKDQRHFLFYFSKMVDECIKAGYLDITHISQVFTSLLASFSSEVLAENGPPFFPLARILAQNFLQNNKKRKQFLVEFSKETVKRFITQSKDLFTFLFAFLLQPLVLNIFWWVRDRHQKKFFAVPLHYQNMDRLLELRENLAKDYKQIMFRKQGESKFKLLLQLLGLILLVKHILLFFETRPYNAPNAIFEIPLATLWLPGLTFLFRINNFNFKCRKDTKQTVDLRLDILKKTLTINPRFKTMVGIKFINLGQLAVSYLLLTPHKSVDLPSRTVAAILQQSLLDANIAFTAEGQEVAVSANATISSNQKIQFKTRLAELLLMSVNIRLIIQQFNQLSRWLECHSDSIYTRVEEGFLADAQPKSRLYVYGNMQKIGQRIANALTELKLTSEQREDHIVTSWSSPLEKNDFKMLIQSLMVHFGVFNFSVSVPPQLPFRKLKKIRGAAPLSTPGEMKTPPSPAPLNVFWDLRTRFPDHPDIKPVAGAIKRFVLFNLPLVCFDNDEKLRERYKSKSMQMARRGLGSQGIKHSTYPGYHFFNGRRQFFSANIKLCDENNHRVLLDIRTAENGEILYTTCAFERNVH
jgi:hypothetical protein